MRDILSDIITRCERKYTRIREVRATTGDCVPVRVCVRLRTYEEECECNERGDVYPTQSGRDSWRGRGTERETENERDKWRESTRTYARGAKSVGSLD